MLKGCPCPEWIKEKLSKDRKGKSRDSEIAKKAVNTRLKNGSYKVSDATKLKISKSLTGIIRPPLTEEHKRKISLNAKTNPNYGMRNKIQSKETRLLHKNGMINYLKTHNSPKQGWVCPDSTKLKISVGNKGNHHTAETWTIIKSKIKAELVQNG